MSRKTKWIIPYIDQPDSFWQKIRAQWGELVHSVYLPLPGVSIGNGRPRQPEHYIREFMDSRIFPLSLLINPVILHEPVETLGDQILTAIEKAVKQWRVREITLTSPELAHLIKSKFPDISIVASTLLDIFTPQQIQYLDNFDVLVPSTRINRDLPALQALRDCFNGEIRLMVNEGCLPSCPYRTQHFYEMSCADIEYPRSLCHRLLVEKPWLRLTGAWVLPQHLHLFNGIYDQLKLAGRVSLADPEKYIRVLDHYINHKDLGPNEIGTGPAGLLTDLHISETFYRHTLFCDKNCQECPVCFDYWNNVNE